jgi:hypothetical protein
MAMAHLEFGDSISGLLVDGVDETPYVGATLRLADPRGVEVEVPYMTMRGSGQFSNVVEWFSSRTPPKNMLLYARDGVVALFDVSWGGHSETYGGLRTSVGTLRPGEAVLGRREGPLTDPLEIQELSSRIDGLNEWTSAESVSHEVEMNAENRIQAVTYELRSPEPIEWKQGEALMKLRASWTVDENSDALRKRTTIDDSVSVISEFEESRPFWDHFVEQRKLATFLVFLFGKPIAFREHHLRDDRFVTRLQDGRIHDRPRYEVISARTIRERATPIPTTKKLGEPIAWFSQVGPEGMQAWSDSYEAWSRFILPSASVLGRNGAYAEDIVVSTSMGLEAAGGLLGEQSGERPTWFRGRPTTATYVYRCLQLVDVNLDKIGDKMGLARAIAKNYNDVKHYDRGDYPDQDITYLVSSFNELLVRLIAMTLTDRGDELLVPYREGNEMWRVRQLFIVNGLFVKADGGWDRTEPPERAVI